ncbi:MAG: hypothetical protein KatS3mg102_2030 [Planctomycetota bacterium]|nr:MAG: hypothetical protein KatS3mg102_2030 [Planctomycetota bacterium]
MNAPVSPPAAAPHTPASRRAIALAAGVVVVVGTAFDLWTKHWAFSAIAPGERVEIIPGFLAFVLSWNTGAAFGILPGWLGFFMVVAALAVGFLVWVVWTAPPGTTWRFGVVVGLIGTGIAGNLYDRIVYGRVRDFIDCYVSYGPLAGRLEQWFGTAHWPTFNVADACIVIGASLLVIKLWRDERALRVAAGAPAALAAAGVEGGDAG